MDYTNTDLAKTFSGLEQRAREIADELAALRRSHDASGMLEEPLLSAEDLATRLMKDLYTLGVQIG